jgi:hypothetical protein
VFKRYEKALTKAMQYAANEAEDDINFKAKSCLYEYYDNYDPNWYDRTDSLRRAFVPYKKVGTLKGEVVAGVGVIYDPSMLDGIYNSNGSEQYQPVNGEWVLLNYLNGIHPRTNGYPIWADELIYDPVVDLVSPDTKMKEYIEDYKKTFDKNVLLSFAKQIARR